MTTQFKESREKCWSARDLYWECLDKTNENVEKCASLRKQYEKFCSKQWVTHFERKRNYEKFKTNIDKVGWEVPPKENR